MRSIQYIEKTFRQNRLMDLVNASSAGIVIVENPDGRVSFANKKAVSILGEDIFRSKKERPSALRLYRTDGSPYDADETPSARSLKTGVEISGEEMMIIKSDGRRFYISVNTSPIFSEDGSIEAVIAVFDDITKRIESEIALRESEEKFSKIFTDNPAPIIITSLDGHIIDANETCLKIIGYSRSELTSGDFLVSRLYYDPSEREKVLKLIREKGKIQNLEFTAVEKSGRIRHLLLSMETITVRGEKYLLSTLLDLTERLAAEAALKESEEKFSNVFKNNPAGIIINVMDSGRILDVNEKATEIFGYSREEFLSPSFSMKQVYLKVSDRDRWLKHLKKYGRVQDREVVIVTKEGVRKNVLISAAIQKINDKDYVLGSVLDITKRRESEEEVKRSKALLDAALSSMTDSVMITDHKGKILVMNQGFVDFYKCADFYECPSYVKDYPQFIEMFTPERSRLPFGKWPFQRALNGERSAMEEYIMRRKDTGQEWSGSYSYSPIKDPLGKITGSVIVSRDITQRIKIEQELKKSQEELKNINDSLEFIVDERTSQLKDTLSILDAERQRLDSVLNMIPAYVAVFSEDHDIVFHNQAYEREFGPIGTERGHDFHEKARRCEVCKIDEVIRSKQPNFWEWNAPNGKIYEVSDFPFRDTGGNELVLEMGLDVTEKKDIERYVLQKVMETEEEGKRRFASDLHDDLGPTLSAAKLQLSLLELELTTASQKDILEFCATLLTESVQKMRTIANSVLPHVLESYGLECAAETFLEKVTSDSGIRFSIKSNLESFRFDNETELHLYRIITELITNTIKHSGANRINLELIINNSLFILKYSDNGKGYYFYSNPVKQSGIGLQNILNRVRMINGTLTTYDKEGTTVVKIVKQL